jgi:D-alanyl-D-alanine dipeptidase
LVGDALRQHTLMYIAHPDAIPPHSTGWAVDVVLYDSQWKLVDMGCPINSLDDATWITYPHLTPEQYRNRMYLTDTMMKVWFANIASEWRHYSYGDRYWAVLFWHKESLYMSV